MRRLLPLSLLLALFVGACTDAPAPTAAPEVSVEATTPDAALFGGRPPVGQPPVPGATCPNLNAAELVGLLRQVFGRDTRGPNSAAAVARFNVVAFTLARRNQRAAQIVVWELVEFIYKKKAETVPQATLARLINGLLCFVGLPPQIPDNNDSFFILPSDEEQVIKRADNRAGVILPANPVGVPSILTIDYSDTIRLDTKLDQYGGGARFTLSSPLVGTAVIAVCPGPLPADAALRARLRLGHNASAGFEVLPPADPAPIGLSCPIVTASTSPLGRMVEAVAQAVLPTKLHARVQEQFSLAGGVGGSASEFSPFAPVDPLLFAAGGVGGSASEFLRMGPSLMAYTAADCPNVEGAIGSPIPTACRPQVTIRTRNGTPFIGVPVTYAVASGGGSVSAEGMAESCGAFGTSVLGTTNTAGVSRACWTLGLTPGMNSVTATPALGGDAVEGVSFSPATLTFTAQGNPAAQFGVVSAATTMAAGGPLPFRIAVQDIRGNTVVPAGGTVTLSLNQGELLTLAQARATGQFADVRAASVTQGFTVPVRNGLVVLDSTTVVKAGSGYQVTVSGAGLPTLTSPTFGVTPGVANQIFVYWFQTPAPAGTTLQPPVRVKDAWFNIIPGAQVQFEMLTPGATLTGGLSTADADGYATPGGWTITTGLNRLRATVVGRPAVTTVIEATGN